MIMTKGGAGEMPMRNVVLIFESAIGLHIQVSAGGGADLGTIFDRPHAAGTITADLLRETATEVERAQAIVKAAEL